MGNENGLTRVHLRKITVVFNNGKTYENYDVDMVTAEKNILLISKTYPEARTWIPFTSIAYLTYIIEK